MTPLTTLYAAGALLTGGLEAGDRTPLTVNNDSRSTTTGVVSS